MPFCVQSSWFTKYCCIDSCKFIVDVFYLLWFFSGQIFSRFELETQNFLLCLQDLPNDLKRRHDTKKTCTSSLVSEFPEDCKFYPADTKDELHKVIAYRSYPQGVQSGALMAPQFRSLPLIMLRCVIVRGYTFLYLSFLRDDCSSCGFLRSKGLQFLIGGTNILTSWPKRWQFCLLDSIYCAGSSGVEDLV